MLLSAACSVMALFAPQSKEAAPQPKEAAQSKEAQDPPPLLTPAEIESLHKKLATLIDTRVKYDESSGPQRVKAQTANEKADAAFKKEWEAKCEKKGDLLKSVADLREIFDNVFQYDGGSKGAGSIRKETPGNFPPYFIAVPKNYNQEVPTRTILLVPGFDEKAGNWQDPRVLFPATWGLSATEKDTVFHIPLLDKKWLHELDRHPDYSKTGEDVREFQRIEEVFKSFGETARNYNFDRRRMIIDGGRESSAFALRLACHFPDRFAGVIVRWPVEMKETRLGSLTGVPVLVISSKDTAAAATLLKKRLDELGPGNVTEIAATDDYPFKAATPEIEKWLGSVQRNLMRTRIVLEPNDDRYRQGYWAGIDRMDQIITSPADRKPRLEVTADRTANRIEVKATGVESFYLHLNDSIVDLSKDFTVVINGKAKTEKRTRDFNAMLNQVLKKYDGGWVFPVTLTSAVPQEEKPASGATGAPGNDTDNGKGKGK